MSRIAGERLVGTLPGQDHGDAPTSKLTNRVHRQRRGRGNGLVEMPNDLLEHLLVVEAAEHHLLVRGAEQSSRPPCFLELVDVLPRAEPYREGPHWMVGESAHDRDNHPGVDPAA